MSSKAFTLIELMMVMAIIGILITIGIPSYRDYAYNAKLAEGYVGVAAINKGQSVRFADKGTFSILELVHGGNASGVGRSKDFLQSANSNQNIGMPINLAEPQYFGYRSEGAYVVDSGNYQITLHDDRTGLDVIYNRGSDLGIKAVNFKVYDSSGNYLDRCNGPRLNTFGISNAAYIGEHVTFTVAAADLKGSYSECTFVIQFLTTQAGQIQTGPIITIRE